MIIKKKFFRVGNIRYLWAMRQDEYVYSNWQSRSAGKRITKRRKEPLVVSLCKYHKDKHTINGKGWRISSHWVDYDASTGYGRAGYLAHIRHHANKESTTNLYKIQLYNLGLEIINAKHPWKVYSSSKFFTEGI